MALVPCTECGHQISTAAALCPQCGAPRQEIDETAPASEDHDDARKVSTLLSVGIFLMPYVFYWFLLRRGYSRQARIMGLVWMAFLASLVAFSDRNAPGGFANDGSRSNVIIDPNRDDKYAAVALAKLAVPSALKDPSSAEFGNVWGMSKETACGYVNGRNGFGAMTGQTRFIFLAGRVFFEDGSASFPKLWNQSCVTSPRGPAPSGAGGLKWGSRPPTTLKQFAPPTDEGLSLYVPKGASSPLEGVAVAESNYNFDHGRFYSASFYIDGENQRDAILKAYVAKFGAPQSYDENAGWYQWKWTKARVVARIDYDEKQKRSTVSIGRP